MKEILPSATGVPGDGGLPSRLKLLILIPLQSQFGRDITTLEKELGFPVRVKICSWKFSARYFFAVLGANREKRLVKTVQMDRYLNKPLKWEISFRSFALRKERVSSEVFVMCVKFE